MSVTSIHTGTGDEPAQDLAAEQSVLGGMMLSKDAITDVVGWLPQQDFYRPAHQIIYEVITELYLHDHPVDAITVAGELDRRQELLKVGGAPYLHTLIAGVPTAANTAYYAEQVRDAADLRRVGELGASLSAYATARGTDADGVLERAQERIAAAVEHRHSSGKTGALLGDLLQPTMDDLASIVAGGNEGLKTGFVDLDEVTNGFHPGQLITVAARPGVGKSALATDFCRAAALKNGVGTLIFSLEMSKSEVVMRLLSAQAQVRYNAMRGGHMTDDDWSRLARHVGEIQDAPLVVDDTAALTVSEINARAKRWNRDLPGGVGLIVVDYLQLMSSNKRAESRQVEVSEFSRSLKLLAKELEVPVVALSQLNRAVEQRNDKKPQLGDLRESGSIEADSDIVLLIHRPDAIERDDPRMGEADLILAKNRGGPQATITVAHQLHYSRFVDMAPE